MAYKIIKEKSFTEIIKSKFTKGMLRFNAKYMLKQAVGRINRLMKHFKSNSQILRNNKDILNMKKDDINDMTKIELSSMLSRLNKFTQSDSSTIKGYKNARRKTIDAFKLNGYDFVNENNLDNLLEFLDDFKESKDAEMYGSDDLMLYFEQADKLGMSIDDLKDNMELFENNYREIENLDVDALHKKYGESISSEQLIDALSIKNK